MMNSAAAFLKRERHTVIAAAVVFAVALLARLIFLAFRGPILAPDSTSYLKLADNILSNAAFSLSDAPPFSPTIRRSPGYPAFLAILGSFGLLAPLAGAVVQSLLGSGIAAITFLLSREVVSRRLAMAAGLIYALQPAAIASAASLLSETLFTSLLVAAIGFLCLGLKRDRLLITAAGGAALGLAILCRPIALPLPFIIAALLIFIIRAPGFRRHALVFPVMAAATIAPWAFRCISVSKHFVLVQGASAVNFYIPTRWDWDQRDESRLWTRFAEEDDYGRRLVGSRNAQEMAEADKYGFSLALRNIKENPAAYVRSRARSFPHLFLNSFDSFTGVNASFGELRGRGDWPQLLAKLVLLVLFSATPLVFGLIGLAGAGRSPILAACAALWVFTLLAHLPMWIEHRFWLPVIPFLFITAAAGGARFSKLPVMLRTPWWPRQIKIQPE